jgi:hypothetical protein
MQEHYFNGSLILDENDQSRMNYIVKPLADNSQQSITDLLDGIYNSNNTISKLMRIVIKPFNSNKVYTVFQSLCIKKDMKYGTYSYHVGDSPLENKLFELVGSNIEVWIEDYTDSTDTEETRHGKSS